MKAHSILNAVSEIEFCTQCLLLIFFIASSHLQPMYIILFITSFMHACVGVEISASQCDQSRLSTSRAIEALLKVSTKFFSKVCSPLPLDSSRNHNKAGYTAIQSRTVGQEQYYLGNRSQFKNVTYRPTNRPTRQVLESRVRD